jgi:hypothetical protein
VGARRVGGQGFLGYRRRMNIGPSPSHSAPWLERSRAPHGQGRVALPCPALAAFANRRAGVVAARFWRLRNLSLLG